MSRCTANTKYTKCVRGHRRTLDGHRCTRTCQDGTDFCFQHNPLNKLDDKTCSICLDDIKNPIKMDGCTHVFCKTCIADSVFHGNMTCPCCRTHMGVDVLAECFELKISKYVALKFRLDVDIAISPWRWDANRPWTQSMTRRYLAVYQ